MTLPKRRKSSRQPGRKQDSQPHRTEVVVTADVQQSRHDSSLLRTTTQAELLTIAPEIRLQIYEKLFKDVVLKKFNLFSEGIPFNNSDEEQERSTRVTCTNTLLVCRLLYSEALPVLYTLATFRYGGVGVFMSQFKNNKTRGKYALDPAAVMAIERVIVDTDASGLLVEPQAQLPSLKHLVIDMDIDTSAPLPRIKLWNTAATGTLEEALVEVLHGYPNNIPEVEILLSLLEYAGPRNPHLLQKFLASRENALLSGQALSIIYELRFGSLMLCTMPHDSPTPCVVTFHVHTWSWTICGEVFAIELKEKEPNDVIEEVSRAGQNVDESYQTRYSTRSRGRVR